MNDAGPPPAVHPAEDPEVRKTGLGGSDMPIVLGLSPFKSPFELWLEKLGRLPPFEGNKATYWGKKLEDMVAREFASVANKDLRRSNKTARHPEHDWAMAHIDRKIVRESACLEVKTSTDSSEWGDQWSDEIPQHILPQVHHQLWVEDLELAYVAVFFLHRREVKFYKVSRSERWDTILEERGGYFWSLVMTKTEPPIDFAFSGMAKVMQKAFGESGAVIKFDERIERLHLVQKELSTRAKELGQAADAIKAEIVHELGDAWVGLLPDGSAYRRNKVKRAGYMVEPTEYFDVRHVNKPPKGALDE